MRLSKKDKLWYSKSDIKIIDIKGKNMFKK